MNKHTLVLLKSFGVVAAVHKESVPLRSPEPVQLVWITLLEVKVVVTRQVDLQVPKVPLLFVRLDQLLQFVYSFLVE